MFLLLLSFFLFVDTQGKISKELIFLLLLLLPSSSFFFFFFFFFCHYSSRLYFCLSIFVSTLSLSLSLCYHPQGFPGGLDYFMLGLTKMGVMDRLQEKSVNASVNAWIRGPGCTICAAWFWAAWRAGKMEVPTIAILVNIVLTFYNGKQARRRR